MIAGAAVPGTSSGFLIMNPILAVVQVQKRIEQYDSTGSGGPHKAVTSGSHGELYVPSVRSPSFGGIVFTFHDCAASCAASRPRQC